MSYEDRQRVLKVLETLKPFSMDNGESGKVLDTFSRADFKIVHEYLTSWLEYRPCLGGQMYGYEVVRLPGDNRLHVMAPNGILYVTL